jgi:hypothetical protein
LPGVTNSPGWVRYITQQHDNESQQFGRDTHRMAKKHRLNTKPAIFKSLAFDAWQSPQRRGMRLCC